MIEAVGYHDTSRAFTMRTLVNFFLLAALHEWKSFRHGADVAKMYGLPTFHYSTVSKKAKEVPYEVMNRLCVMEMAISSHEKTDNLAPLFSFVCPSFFLWATSSRMEIRDGSCLI
ncbi:MAG: hypothetical protein K6T72_00160 [Anoxybacillus sp.]|nr:hypothetical protein [Anoxybacillus sp.]